VPTDKHFGELAGVDHPLEEYFFNHVLRPVEGVPRLESILRKVYLGIIPSCGCGLRFAGCGLWVAGCGLRVVGCGLWVVGYGLWVERSHDVQKWFMATSVRSDQLTLWRRLKLKKRVTTPPLTANANALRTRKMRSRRAPPPHVLTNSERP
jgi:hypothetical protein